MTNKINVGILGVSGFLGMELNSILSKRKDVNIAYMATSEIQIGSMDNIQVVFLALQPEQSIKKASQFLQRGIKVIDLSGAHRLKSAGDFEKYYKLADYPSALSKIAVYGLPEKNREKICTAYFVANPGCYATAIELGLFPLVKNNLVSNAKIIVRASSGYTGAGRKAKIPKTITPYKGGRQHQHVPEIEQELSIRQQLLFYPQVAPWPRGIEAVIRVKMSAEADILGLYEQFYANELFVRVKPNGVKTENVVDTNFCDIFPEANGLFATIKVAIDNIGKGGAGQAIQNFNIMFGLPESLVYSG